MTTNSFQQLSYVTLRSDARNYWFAILDAMTSVMEIEKRSDYVKSWKYDKDKDHLTIRFNADRTGEIMIGQIVNRTGIDIKDITFEVDVKKVKTLVISAIKYDDETMNMAESIASLYGYFVPKDERNHYQLMMKHSSATKETINTALENDYEEEDVTLNGIIIGKCIKRNLDICIVELNKKALERWKNKSLIKKSMSVTFSYGKKTAQIKCFRNSLNRLFRVGSVPAPENANLSDFVFNTTLACPIGMTNQMTPQSKKLNEEQAKAVAMALKTEDISIIQGPPGTGKTTVITKIVNRMIAKNPDSRILIASQTNVAVDNAIERLAKDEAIHPIHPLRIGRLNKIDPKVKEYCYQHINDWAEGKTDDKCAACKDEKCTDYEDEICSDYLTERAKLRSAYLRSVNLFGATCCSSGMGTMRHAYNEVYNSNRDKEQPWFDTLIIDEASKATLLDMAIPMVMAKHIILIGDQKQLPPYCDKDKSRLLLALVRKSSLVGYMYDVKNDKLRPSQFERMITNAINGNKSIVTTLCTQHRMPEDIMNLLQPFYEEEGGLICGVSDDKCKHGLRFGNWLNDNTHAIFLNVNGEESKSGTSHTNEQEEEAIRRVVKALQMSAYVDGKEMPETGIISFYKPQARKFEDIDGIKSATVDKFQGAEKDIIILSTVRTNKLGFISDRRRLNVALSRAKSLLIVVGNQKLLNTNDDYRYVIENMDVVNYDDIKAKLPQ